MKSDVIHISTGGTGISEALKQAEAVAAFKSLSKKDSIHLMLLAEELTGMFKALTGEMDADFWIETNADNYEIHLSADTAMNYEKRKKLLAASTSGKNATTGFMSKVRNAFEAAITAMENGYAETVGVGVLEAGGRADYVYWTLTQYKQNAQSEDWDELERSVVAKLADEVKVCIKGANVEMTIEKKI